MADANARLEAASEAKSRFVASVSHEIRTPINAVLGFADLLAGPELNPAQQRYVNVIQNTGRQLSTLLNGILAIAKLEAGRLDLERVDFSLAANSSRYARCWHCRRSSASSRSRRWCRRLWWCVVIRPDWSRCWSTGSAMDSCSPAGAASPCA